MLAATVLVVIVSLSDSHLQHWGLAHHLVDAIGHWAPQGPVHVCLPPDHVGSVLGPNRVHPPVTQGQLLPGERAGGVHLSHSDNLHAQPLHLCI